MASNNSKWSEPLSDFLLALDAYEPTVPTQVTRYYVKKAGLDPDADPRVVKLISLAADKFLADTVFEAKQSLELRNVSKKRTKEAADLTLELQDVESSYEKQGIFQRRRLYAKDEAGKK